MKENEFITTSIIIKVKNSLFKFYKNDIATLYTNMFKCIINSKEKVYKDQLIVSPQTLNKN